MLKQYPHTWDLVHDKILFFAIQPRAPLPLCGCGYVLSAYVTEYSGHQTRTHKTVMILSLLLDRL